MELTIQLGSASDGKTLRLQVTQRSDIGDRTENQDALGHQFVGDWLVCVLADGAGGHRGGRLAATMAVRMLLAEFVQSPTLERPMLLDMIKRVNQHILSHQAEHADCSDMHTTICLLVVHQRSGRSVWLHVGDSRVYHFHQALLRSRTKDHSVRQWMIDHEKPEPCTARNALYTALGEHAEQLHIGVSECCQLKAGDWLLICSDGLWEHLSDDELALLGANLWGLDDCNTHIHELALQRALGRSDNLSSLLIFVSEGGAYSG